MDHAGATSAWTSHVDVTCLRSGGWCLCGDMDHAWVHYCGNFMTFAVVVQNYWIITHKHASSSLTYYSSPIFPMCNCFIRKTGTVLGMITVEYRYTD